MALNGLYYADVPLSNYSLSFTGVLSRLTDCRHTMAHPSHTNWRECGYSRQSGTMLRRLT